MRHSKGRSKLIRILARDNVGGLAFKFFPLKVPNDDDDDEMVAFHTSRQISTTEAWFGI